MKLAKFILLLLAPMLSFASDNNIVYECINSKALRVIEVNYMTNNTLPCAVVYSKADGREVLWSAKNTEGYCEQKAATFVKKQQSWGWDCHLAGEQQLVEQGKAENGTVIEVAAEPELGAKQ
ncbi:hypothetical protein [Paraferrimonas sp. SM1919]|uniref:hypothetical protein n=1 Tax=Paraferrimonas sp. SM1919 TaxID=2662263 RepID=UPI001969D531|nr:hypothetical protein [Paraferrimonas sp. SM1919]